MLSSPAEHDFADLMTQSGPMLDPAHLPAVREGLAQAKRRAFASDADIEAAFRHFEA
ncbi:MAG: hypothetical protein KGJ79_01420 [Alphaproteobacteria bacterium]|nr:hypothetical protein [Alphaproteobacteria bacterium]MDE2495659.1 hypothetical protein [Alphaproteobacteria bacterium]